MTILYQHIFVNSKFLFTGVYTTRSGWNVVLNEITFWWGICKAKYDDIHAHSLLTTAKKSLKNDVRSVIAYEAKLCERHEEKCDIRKREYEDEKQLKFFISSLTFYLFIQECISFKFVKFVILTFVIYLRMVHIYA